MSPSMQPIRKWFLMASILDHCTASCQQDASHEIQGPPTTPQTTPVIHFGSVRQPCRMVLEYADIFLKFHDL